MEKTKVLSVANQKGGVDKSTTVYNLGAGLAMSGKKVLALDVDPQGDLTKMLGQRKPHDLPLALANSMNDVVAGTLARDHPEIMHHQEGFDFVPRNRSLSAVEQRLAQNFVPQRKLADVGQFKNAVRVRGNPTELTFHSNRGGQYTSDTFSSCSDSVKQSFSRSGRPCDNAVAETFFASFKREEAYRRDYSPEADFRKSVDEYVRFYNEQRPHQTLAYKSPVRFEELYGQKGHRLCEKTCV